MWFYVQELPKAQPEVVLVLKRLRRRGNSLKSHPTDWEKLGIEPATPGLQDIGLSPTPFCGFSMGRNQYWAGRVYDLCVYYMTGTPEGSTESGFMEKPGIEPATPGLQDIGLSHTPRRPKKYTIPWRLYLILWQLLYRLNKYDFSNNMS